MSFFNFKKALCTVGLLFLSSDGSKMFPEDCFELGV